MASLARWQPSLLPLLLLAAPAAVATPPPFVAPPLMGFLSWNAFGCGVTDAKMRATASALQSTGLASAGYIHVAVDDCWAKGRDASGTLISDPIAFPAGMAALSQYIHSLGLQFGIYTAIGNTTCAGRPGSFGHELQDVALFAAWNVTYLKVDNCNYSDWTAATLYLRFKAALDAQAYRIPMVNKAVVNYSVAVETSVSRRVGWDISPSFSSLLELAYMAEPLWAQARPGNVSAGVSSFYTDIEMLEVGNGRLSMDEAWTQLALWSVMHAPLILSTNISALSPEELGMVGNPEMIAIDQDGLGVQGRRVQLDAVTALSPALPLAPASIACSLPPLIAPGQAWELQPASAPWPGNAFTARLRGNTSLCLQRPFCNGTITVDACPTSAACSNGGGGVWLLGVNGTLQSALGGCVQMDPPRVRQMNCHGEQSDQQFTYINATGQLANIVTNPAVDYTGYDICLDALPSTHTEVFAGPLSNGDVAVVMLNPTSSDAVNMTAYFGNVTFPTQGVPPFTAARVRDVRGRTDLGTYNTSFSALVDTHASMYVRLSPLR